MKITKIIFLLTLFNYSISAAAAARRPYTGEDLSRIDIPPSSPGKRVRSESLDVRSTRVVIIGGGYTGIMSALLLARHFSDTEILLIEKNRHLLTGASLSPGRLHLGGEYPLDHKTATSCLWGAFLFKQMFGDAVLTDIPAAQYLIAKKTADSDLSVNEQFAFYDTYIRQKYQELYDRFYKKGVNEDDFFGPPEELITPIGKDKLPSTHFAGGVEIKERGIHPLKMAAALKNLLIKSGVRIMTDTDVIDVDKSDLWTLETNNGEIHANVVVNATWQEIYSLDQKVSKDSDAKLESPSVSSPRPAYHIFSRAMLIADISSAIESSAAEGSGSASSAAAAASSSHSPIPSSGNKRMHAFFGLLGSEGGMCCPINPNTALLYWPSTKGSYIAETKLGGLRESSTPDFVRRTYHAKEEGYTPGKVSQQILENLQSKYPILKEAEPISLIVRETLAYDKDIDKRPPMPVKEVAPGWFSALSTKATFAPITALNVLKQVMIYTGELSESFSTGRMSSPTPRAIKSKITTEDFILNLGDVSSDKTWILPSSFRFGTKIDKIEQADCIQDAYTRGLPVSMAFDGISMPFSKGMNETTIFLQTRPQIINIAGKELDFADVILILKHLQEPSTKVKYLNLSYIRLSSREWDELNKAFSVNKTLKSVYLRGMDLIGDNLSRILKVLQSTEVEFLDISSNNIHNQPARNKEKNLLDIHKFIVEASDTMDALVLDDMGISDKDSGIITAAVSKRSKKGIYPMTIKANIKNSPRANNFSGAQAPISDRGLTYAQMVGMSRQLSLSLESDAALAAGSYPYTQ